MSDEADVSRLQRLYNENHAIELKKADKNPKKAAQLLRGGSPETDDAPLPVQEHDLTVENQPDG